jgi:NTE family protein
MSKNIVRIPKKQRALILQGGVALGAYEAGVLKTLLEKISEEDGDEHEKQGGIALFDIIAGTSAGAINAAILVSYFLNNDKSWSGAEKVLEDFWDYISTPTPLLARTYQTALGESARRYYSAKYFVYEGVQNVFSISALPEIDYRFHDYLPFFNYRPNVNPNIHFFYQNDRLFESLQSRYEGTERSYANSRIRTRFEDGEPRLLVIATNVHEGRSATFDSYSGDGIDMQHVKASSAFPLYFQYVEIDGHQFCDGGILSNTPLRELIQYHRDFWLDYLEKTSSIADIISSDRKVPDLEIYLINVWPTREENVQLDHDGVKDRRNDILYSDKTEYDQKIALLVSDYVDLVVRLQAIADEAIDLVQEPTKKNRLREKIKKVLNSNTRSEGRTPRQRRKFEDLITGRFDLVKVVTIERTDDPDNISDKWADFSSETIRQLIDDGERYKTKATVKTLYKPE